MLGGGSSLFAGVFLGVFFFWAGGSWNMFRARLDWKRKNPMERKQRKLKFSSLFQFPSIYICHFIEFVFSFHLNRSTSQGYPEDLRVQIHLNPLQQNQDETSFRFSATHAKSHHPSHFLKLNSFFGELNM